MKTLNDYLNLIETRLDIKNCLVIEGEKILPNKKALTKKDIRKKMLDDLFQYHDGQLVFSNRFLSFVSDITDRQVLAGHYFLELRGL